MYKLEIINEGICKGFKDMNQRLNSYLSLFNDNTNTSEIVITDNYNIFSNKVLYKDTIEHDVNRSFNRNYLIKNIDDKYYIKEDLKVILFNFFYNNKGKYTYYQGFNAIAEIFYIEYDKIICLKLLNKLSELYFHKYLKNNFQIVIKDKIDILKNIINLYKYKCSDLEVLLDELYN